jgi:hypothetical protein
VKQFGTDVAFPLLELVGWSTEATGIYKVEDES